MSQQQAEHGEYMRWLDDAAAQQEYQDWLDKTYCQVEFEKAMPQPVNAAEIKESENG